jgi:hypothetical protein
MTINNINKSINFLQLNIKSYDLKNSQKILIQLRKKY